MPDADPAPAQAPADRRGGGNRRGRATRRRGERRGSRRWRWLRRLGVGGLLVALLLVAALVVVTRPAVLTPLLEKQLSAATRAEVTLRRASVKLSGEVRLEGLAVRLPEGVDASGRATPRADRDYHRLLEVERLTLHVGRQALLLLRLNLWRVDVQGPTLHAVLEGGQGRSNLRAWADRFAGDEPEPDEEDPGSFRLPPTIEVRDAVLDLVQLEETPEGETREAARHLLPFDGLVSPRGEGAAAALAFELVGGTPAGATEPGTNLSGRWEPARQKLVLEVERVDLASPLGLLMPPEARRTWRELDPAGDLPSLTLETRLDRTGTEALQRAELEVKNLSFRLPLATLGLLPEGETQADAPRMTGVTGTVVVEDGRLSTRRLVGEIEGIRCGISGEAPIDGRGDFALVAETDAFDVPATPPLLFRLPGLISRTYDEYKPSGRFSARVEIARRNDEPVRVDGRLRVIDARTVFHAFAYPVEHLDGDVIFRRDRLELRNLTGEGPEGGRVTLDGTVTRPGPDAGIDLSIQVKAVPVNEPLMAALDPGLRSTILGFFSKETAQRLAEQNAVAGGSVEAFEPGGRLNGQVRVKRDTAVRPKSWVELDLDAEGLRLMMPAFPYPLKVQSGWLRVGPEEVIVENVVATGPSGGAGTIHGVITLPPQMHLPPRIDLRLADVDLPIDAYLFGALDAEAAAWLRRLGVRGRVTGGGLLGAAAVSRAASTPPGPPADGEDPPAAASDAPTRAEDRLEMALDLRLADGWFTLWGGDVVLRGAEAEVRVSRDAVRIDRVSAEYPDGGRLGVEGRVDLPGGGLRLLIEAQELGLGERVALLIPPELPAREAALGLLRRYGIGGVADAEVLLRTVEPNAAAPALDGDEAAPARELAWEVRARPSSLRGVYDGRPVRLDGVTGVVDFREDAVRLRSLAGRNGLPPADEEADAPPAEVTVSGRIPYDPAEPTELEIEADGPSDDALLMAFTPAGVRDAMAAVSLEAGVSLRDGRLRLGPVPVPASASTTSTTDAGAPLPFGFDGVLTLRDATASLGLPVTEAEATATVRASGDGDGGWPGVEATLEAPGLTYADRRIEGLSLRADNRDRPAVVALRGVTAALAGGRVSGSGEVRLGDEPNAVGRDGAGQPPGAGGYRIDLSVEGAEAEPVIYPDEPMAGGGTERSGEAGAGGDDAATAPPEVRREVPRGRLWASLTAEGEAGRPETVTGRGRVRIRGGDLLRGTAGIALLRAINLWFPTDAPLGTADAGFVLSNGRVRLQDASIRGEGLRLDGSGWVDFPSGELYLTLFTTRETNRFLRGFQRLFDTIKDELIGIEVVGTVWEPDARVSTLAGLRGEVEDRIGQTAPPLIRPAVEDAEADAPTPSPSPSPSP